ncbi:hypothetical protein [Phenylobacterium montanum]|uniref:hypothetical protein n=1 Tax=Phenylobacterium montanum TaxID=2823693 RepID=UPI002011EA1A|nr:hypothetical protein [Caulobacter sp. S6]
MEKALIAQRVANKLFATENAVDAAILEASQLLAGMIEARQEIGFSAVLGSDAAAKIGVALNALTEARAAVVASHNELAEAKLRLGIRTRMIGSGPKSFGENVVTGSANDRLAG